MGTKNKPGVYDCYSAAEPDEPMFVLLGRDKCAPVLVQLWAEMRRVLGEDPSKVKEAEECAEAMRRWLSHVGKTEAGFGCSFWIPDGMFDTADAESGK